MVHFHVSDCCSNTSSVTAMVAATTMSSSLSARLRIDKAQISRLTNAYASNRSTIQRALTVVCVLYSLTATYGTFFGNSSSSVSTKSSTRKGKGRGKGDEGKKPKVDVRTYILSADPDALMEAAGRRPFL